MSEPSVCWCGNASLAEFSLEYARCQLCETLVLRRMPTAAELAVNDDERDFYGRHYFDRMAGEYGLPPLAERARSDLSERCLHWLRALLKYKLPPARVLEIGSAHGGFVALMRAAGFDATGLDVSLGLAQYARETFEIPMLAGPLESQTLEPASLDAVVLMDVLEHLANPEATLRHALSLLKPDGILFLQTPRYRERKTLGEMHADGDRFVEMLRPWEHLYLFSQTSVASLLERLGAGHLHFEPAIFSAYDMSLVGSRAPLSPYPEAQVEACLLARRDARLALALLDLDKKFQTSARNCLELETAAQRLEKALAESGADRPAHLENMRMLDKLARQAQAEGAEARRELAALGQLVAGLCSELADKNQRRAELAALLERQSAQLRETERTRDALTSNIANLLNQNRRLEKVLDRLCNSHVYRVMRAFGLWGWLGPENTVGEPAVTARRAPRGLRKVVVDLTPVLPGGENGGAKVLTLELIRNMARQAGDCEFILLTLKRNHEELAALDSANVRRVLVEEPGKMLSAADSLGLRARRALSRVLPAPILDRLGRWYRGVSGRISFGGSLVRNLDADLLFSPFTAPYYFDPDVPAVSILYDLQHIYYPQFFSAAQVVERERSFRQACRLSSRIICISDYVRRTVLENESVVPARLETIPILLSHRLPEPSAAAAARVLEEWKLQPERFLLYPANFWAHKNHEMLLTAFALYRTANPASGLKLVLTGAPGPRRDFLMAAARRMGLSEAVIFPGYLPEEDFAVLMRSAMAVIFPSLFEGFGIPLLEAMAAARPMAVSRSTSLPEVAGDAALLFDPRKPAEIAQAIQRLEREPALRHELAQRGMRRLEAFGGPVEMAERYLKVFRDAIYQPAESALTLHGAYHDGWLSERNVVAFGPGQGSRRLVIELSLPAAAPVETIAVRLTGQAGVAEEGFQLSRGGVLSIERPLDGSAGWLELLCTPTFQPRPSGIGKGSRRVACQLGRVEIVDADGTVVPLESPAYAV